MFKALLQNNCSNTLSFKINVIKKSIKFEMRLFKFESTSLIFNNNEIINIVNTNFNILEFDVSHSKICEIKKLIVNPYLISLSTRYNAFKSFKTSSFKSIIFFQFMISLASFLNTRILNLTIKIVKI